MKLIEAKATTNGHLGPSLASSFLSVFAPLSFSENIVVASQALSTVSCASSVWSKVETLAYPTIMVAPFMHLDI